MRLIYYEFVADGVFLGSDSSLSIESAPWAFTLR